MWRSKRASVQSSLLTSSPRPVPQNRRRHGHGIPRFWFQSTKCKNWSTWHWTRDWGRRCMSRRIASNVARPWNARALQLCSGRKQSLFAPLALRWTRAFSAVCCRLRCAPSANNRCQEMPSARRSGNVDKLLRAKLASSPRLPSKRSSLRHVPNASWPSRKMNFPRPNGKTPSLPTSSARHVAQKLSRRAMKISSRTSKTAQRSLPILTLILHLLSGQRALWRKLSGGNSKQLWTPCLRNV